MDAPEVSRTTAWMRVGILTLSAFIFNTTEFAPIGLLSDIANSFSIPSERVGLIITLYAWIVTIASLTCIFAIGQVERRRLLTGIFILFIASHVLTAIAWNFSLLVLSRAGVALSHAIFWSITASLAIRVAPPGKRAQALSLLAGGTALAMVLGLPVGRIIGQWFGWRMTFAGIAASAAFALIMVLKFMPELKSENAGSLTMVPELLRRWPLVFVYIITVIVVTAHFSTYSYIEPFIQNLAGMSENVTTLILLIFGVSGIAGSLLFGRYGERYPIAFLNAALTLLLISLVFLFPSSNSQVSLTLLCALWGMAIMAFGLSMQAKVLNLAPDATDVAMGFFSGLYNFGIGSGALLGNLVIQGWGIGAIGFVAASIVFLAMSLSFLLRRFH
ncbi:sugar transporter [Serratia sp. 121840015-1]